MIRDAGHGLALLEATASEQTSRDIPSSRGEYNTSAGTQKWNRRRRCQPLEPHLQTVELRGRNDNPAKMEDRRPAIVGVIIAFQVLSWLALGLRLYVRRFMVKLVGWDDSRSNPTHVVTLDALRERLTRSADSPDHDRNGSCPGPGHPAALQYGLPHHEVRRSLLTSLSATKYGLGLHIWDVALTDLKPMLEFVWWSGVRGPATPAFPF